MEPGCYFISALLVPAMESPDTSRFFNVDAIRKFMGSGGVRIESDVVLYIYHIVSFQACSTYVYVGCHMSFHRHLAAS